MYVLPLCMDRLVISTRIISRGSQDWAGRLGVLEAAQKTVEASLDRGPRREEGSRSVGCGGRGGISLRLRPSNHRRRVRNQP